jgi:hypothetical protein
VLGGEEEVVMILFFSLPPLIQQIAGPRHHDEALPCSTIKNEKKVHGSKTAVRG